MKKDQMREIYVNLETLEELMKKRIIQYTRNIVRKLVRSEIKSYYVEVELKRIQWDIQHNMVDYIDSKIGELKKQSVIIVGGERKMMDEQTG